jgi:predicted DNA-binding antitoxin AbrB/MazE fold protein
MAMTINIEAVYTNGAFRPKQPVNLAEGTPVELTVHTGSEVDDPFEAVIGTCEGPPDGAANHHKYLYGEGRS